MNIFNSLGSNYTSNFVWRSLFALPRGHEVARLKGDLASRYGGEVVLTYKCRQALRLALELAELPANSQVGITGFTCFAVYQSVVDAGYQPVFLDIDPQTLNFTADTLSRACDKNQGLAAVIIQNTLGKMSDIVAISKLCRQRGLIIIEDLAHSLGNLYSTGQEAGTVGDFTTLSFSQDKVVDGTSGGALIIRNTQYQKALHISSINLPVEVSARDRFYPLITMLIRTTYPYGLGRLIHKSVKALGLLPRPMDGHAGTRLCTLPPWYADMINAQYQVLDATREHRRVISEIYAHELKGAPLGLVDHAPESVPLRFPILVNNRQGLLKYLTSQGVHITDTWYDAPVAPPRYMSRTSYMDGTCPNAEEVAKKIVNLPVHINTSQEAASRIATLINGWLSHEIHD